MSSLEVFFFENICIFNNIDISIKKAEKPFEFKYAIHIIYNGVINLFSLDDSGFL